MSGSIWFRSPTCPNQPAQCRITLRTTAPPAEQIPPIHDGTGAPTNPATPMPLTVHGSCTVCGQDWLVTNTPAVVVPPPLVTPPGTPHPTPPDPGPIPP